MEIEEGGPLRVARGEGVNEGGSTNYWAAAPLPAEQPCPVPGGHPEGSSNTSEAIVLAEQNCRTLGTTAPGNVLTLSFLEYSICTQSGPSQ